MRITTTAAMLLAFALPVHAQSPDTTPRQVVTFMRSVIDQVNPVLAIEDSHCATALPWAILRQTQESGLDWKQVFVLAWQESAFDCHAKNRRDRGGAYGPFQIRRVWEPISGDPRVRYYDPDLAVKRVVKVLRYYHESDRFTDLERRQFRYPLLCLYNAGERRDVNMKYCKQVGLKMDSLLRSWEDYRAGRLVAIAN